MHPHSRTLWMSSCRTQTNRRCAPCAGDRSGSLLGRCVLVVRGSEAGSRSCRVEEAALAPGYPTALGPDICPGTHYPARMEGDEMVSLWAVGRAEPDSMADALSLVPGTWGVSHFRLSLSSPSMKWEPHTYLRLLWEGERYSFSNHT